MRNFLINLLALVFIALAVLCAIPSALVDCVRYSFSGLRWVFNKVTARILKFVFALAGLTGALSVMAAETAGGTGLDLTAIVLPFLIKAAAANPAVATGLAIWAFAQPFVGFIANKTKNPHIGKVAILGNKVLQLMTFNSSKNQPDVLSVSEMLTTKPSSWEDKIRDKVLNTIGR